MPQITYDPDFVVPRCAEDPVVLYSDQFIVVAEKPSGLLSIPGRNPRNRDSLIARLEEQFPSIQIVHRLDMDTSGVMVMALTKKAHAELSRQFRDRLVAKTYQAIAAGHLVADEGKIDYPLITDWPNRPLQKVCYEEGKPSLTYFSVIQRRQDPDTTLVELRPHTGRSHQLRLHLKTLGHPILGDKFYGDNTIRSMAPRLLLHASRLQFLHPTSGEALDFHAGYSLADLPYSQTSLNC